MSATAGDELAWHESRPTFRQVPDWLLMHPEISDAALRTWLVLAKFADDERGAFPGVATIASARGKGRSVIFEHLDALERAGAIRRNARYRPNGGGRTTTLYVLAWSYPLTSMSPENRTQAMSPENRTGGMSPGSRTGARPENRTPITRTRKEREPLTPTADAVGEQTSSSSTIEAHPPRRRRGTRADGTNPRALARREAEAAERAQRLVNDRRFGARTADHDRATTVEEFSERLHAEADRDPRAGWDEERIAAAVAGFAEAASAHQDPDDSSAPVIEDAPAHPLEGLRSAREALRRGRKLREGDVDDQLSLEDASL